MARTMLISAVAAVLLFPLLAASADEDECLAGSVAASCQEAQVEDAEEATAAGMRVELLQKSLLHLRGRGTASAQLQATMQVGAGGPDAGAAPEDGVVLFGHSGGLVEEALASSTKAKALTRGSGVGSDSRACDDNAITKTIAVMAPACAVACPQICDVLLPVFTVFLGGGNPMVPVCASQAQFSCAIEPANVDACKVALDKAAGFGIAVPRTLADFNSTCESLSLEQGVVTLHAEEAEHDV